MGLLAGLGRTVGRAGSSKAALGAIGVGAMGLGLATSVGESIVDANMDVAFGAPDADKFFTGREISSRYLAGRAIGGGFGTAMQATDPISAMTYSGGENIPGQTTTMAGGAIGAVGGAFAGGKMGGLKGAIAGGLVGGLAGASLPAANVANTYRNERTFFNETAYGRGVSSSNAAALGAVGDIVLGMHNSRNGY